MNTLKLTSNWDLKKDILGNIELATGSQAIAQDVASAIKLFLGELWYDVTQGVPYFEHILGQEYAISVIESLKNTAALTVADVVFAKATIESIIDRLDTGNVKVIDKTGVTLNVKF